MQHFESSLGQDRRCGQEVLKILKNSCKTEGVDQERKIFAKTVTGQRVWTRSLKICKNIVKYTGCGPGA
jgi:hypothetical protein